MINWKLQLIPLKSLKDYHKNPRKIHKEQLKLLEELIQKFGLIDKPIVNRDFTIIGGHQRVKVLKKMKAKEIECWVPDVQLEPADIDRLCVGLNLNQGTWDYDILANQFELDDLLGYGFTEDVLLGHFEEKEPKDQAKEKKKKVCPHCGNEF